MEHLIWRSVEKESHEIHENVCLRQFLTGPRVQTCGHRKTTTFSRRVHFHRYIPPLISFRTAKEHWRQFGHKTFALVMPRSPRQGEQVSHYQRCQRTAAKCD